MATAIRKGFHQFYERNEYAHDLDKNKLEGLVVEVTGLEQGHSTVRSIVGTFQTLKSLADFDKGAATTSSDDRKAKATKLDKAAGDEGEAQPLKLNLAYTINLVLPKSDDIAVFNAIFKSLKDNLLKS